jgi:hypothetical protein
LAVLTTTFVKTITALLASLKKLPAGIRMKINEIEDDSNKYSIYTYKDTESDESFGFFIGLNREVNLPPTLHR